MFICIALDLVGMGSYIFPGLGEFVDVVWAPLSGYLLYKLFGGTLGVVGGVIDAIEEALPYSDAIPSFTIAWYLRRRQGL